MRRYFKQLKQLITLYFATHMSVGLCRFPSHEISPVINVPGIGCYAHLHFLKGGNNILISQFKNFWFILDSSCTVRKSSTDLQTAADHSPWKMLSASHIMSILHSLQWLPVRQLVIFKTAVRQWKCIHGVCRAYLHQLCVAVETAWIWRLRRLAAVAFNSR